MILIGDIGGTNARLALAEPGTTEPVGERSYATADFPDFAAVLAAYLGATGAEVSAGCLALAGPIADDGRSARLTNLPWTVDAAVLEAEFGLGRVTLVNDFAAAALGVTVAPANAMVCLQPGEPVARAVKLVIGAGTGLGMAVLVAGADGWRVLPGEGGHIGFAPADEAQLAVWRALNDEHGRVTSERVVSGPGLAAIHRILAGEDLPPAEIARRALADHGSPAGRSVDVFLAAYGAYAGDMAMAVMARGGVYLAGGIAGKVLPLLQRGAFLRAFAAKAEHANLVARMPITVVTDESLGLRGAAGFALNSVMIEQ